MGTSSAPACRVCVLHAEATFRVEGMDCHEEVAILERRLRPLAGLESVSADVMGQRLHVQYDASRLSASDLVDAVGDTGMRMWLEQEEPVSVDPALEWRWRLVLAASAALAAGGLLTVGGHDGAARWGYLAAALLGGVYPARRALVSLRTRNIDINVLMLVAVLGAVALGDWLEAAAVVVLFALAQWLEVRTLDRARQAIRALLDLSPVEALVQRPDGERRMRLDEVAVGDVLIVRPGEKVPLDGVIVAGRGDVNEAPLTGESLPVDKAPGATVFAGTINGHGALEVQVSRLRRDTRLARIVHLVETAQAQRAPVQSFVERFARVYTPVVIGLAVLVALVPWLAGGDGRTWIYRALTLLVTACPCALVISTPVSMVSALAGAARRGVLIKGGAHLERLAGVRVVAFDKTGTLTRGELGVHFVRTVDGISPQELLRLVGPVEQRAKHPVAAAIAAHAAIKVGALPRASAVTLFPGLGVEGTVDGHSVLVGNARLLASRVPLPDGLELDGALKAEGGALALAAVDGRFAGIITLHDQPRESAREAVELLRRQGIAHVTMLTGDQADAASHIGDLAGIEDQRSALLPDEKHAAIRELRETYGSVLMVGDGINDAPALAVADVGMAMGAAASDAALETADVALLSGELLRVPYALRLAKATLRNIHVNVAIALGLKVIVLAAAAAGVATLWMAILADTGASVIVVVNALRLLRAR